MNILIEDAIAQAKMQQKTQMANPVQELEQLQDTVARPFDIPEDNLSINK